MPETAATHASPEVTREVIVNAFTNLGMEPDAIARRLTAIGSTNGRGLEWTAEGVVNVLRKERVKLKRTPTIAREPTTAPKPTQNPGDWKCDHCGRTDTREKIERHQRVTSHLGSYPAA